MINKANRTKKVKKAQQETVGFVMIIIIVMVVGVIFLGITLRNQNKAVYIEDAEISNFLSASLSYTTECYKDHDSDFKNLGELVRYCYNSGKVTCPNSKTSCQVLNETYSDMLKVYKPAGVLQYAKMTFTYNSSASEQKLLETTSGTIAGCLSKRMGRQEIDSGDGRVIVELEVCLKED